ncbi:hypothetical protein [Bifidobacterium miconisargentati]|uniref:hypothetical protein n=1 Tax=Bifidobacterium miconisargentati TaxID=2834437 RepID=UPI001BDD5516|nr:hypothetical protein [Bifidobacterium miconisargentati]MBW3089246.1 hypothetical protein [Bifidobacterium miconisargentati]
MTGVLSAIRWQRRLIVTAVACRIAFVALIPVVLLASLSGRALFWTSLLLVSACCASGLLLTVVLVLDGIIDSLLSGNANLHDGPTRGSR